MKYEEDVKKMSPPQKKPSPIRVKQLCIKLPQRHRYVKSCKKTKSVSSLVKDDQLLKIITTEFGIKSTIGWNIYKNLRI